MSPKGGALNSIVRAHVKPRRRRRSFLPIIIGATMIGAGIIGFRSAQELANDVPLTDGVIVDGKFLPADGGRPLGGNSLVAVLTVEYLALGENRRSETTVNTSSAAGQVLYGEG